MLSDSGFASADGTIVATFDSHAAPTSCPSEQRCLVTVPPGSPGSVVVWLRTESGVSNSRTFDYR
jgi:hypothetical protein